MIAIITAMEVEMERITARMENVREEVHPGLRCLRGTLCGKETVAAVCSVGKTCAAQQTQALLSAYRPEAVFHTGIAGAVGKDLRHLDLVCAREVTDRDLSEHTKREFLPFGGYFVADPRLTSLLRAAAPDSHLGCMVTGDRFVETTAEKLRLQQDFNALCADMESAAVAQVCAVNRTPFAILRCISDLADDSARSDYEGFERKAAERSAETLCKAIEQL